MINTAFSTSDLIPALAALAVLERADAAALAALLEQKLSADELAVLRRHPSVREEEGQFVLAPEAASAIRTGVEGHDLPRYRTLLERAIFYLAGQLRADEGAVEPIFVAVFERLANRLLTDNPGRFIELVDSVRDIPLNSSTGRQRRHYFEGLALCKAERYLEALAVFDVLLVEPDLEPHVHARTLNSRAVCCRLIGRLEEALAGYRASLELWQRLGDRRYEGIVRMNMGIIAYELQNYDQASDSLYQAADIFEEIGSRQWLAAVQNELGLVHRDQGHWAEALAYFERYIAQRRVEDAHNSLGQGLNNVGEVLLFQGRLEDATAAFQEALEKMTTRAYSIDTRLNLGLTHQTIGNLTLAQTAFQEALTMALEIGRREILPHVHYRLGDVLRRLGDNDAALSQFKAGAEVIEAIQAPIRDEELKISLLGRWQQVYEALVLYCLDQGRVAEAFAWAERARARAFVDALLAKQPAPQTKPVEFLSTVATVDEIQAALPVDGMLLCYFTTGVLAQDIPLLKAIPDDNPLREHLLTPAQTILFVVTKDDLTAHKCAIDPNMFATASPRGHDPERFLTLAVRQHLYTVLLETAESALAAKHLTIVPHGPLHQVPFNALVDPHGQPLLRFGGPTLAYAPSATVLLRHCLALAPPHQLGPSCLAVGYNGRRGGRTLRYTEAEVKVVANLMGGQAWTGREPKKDRLRREAGQQHWLHIACHGWFNHQQPLESYLEVGLEEQLTALEVMRDWHLQAALVTLSACQTGLSRILRGDEPMGLIRAFLYAGAKAVLVSQWPVHDLPTCLLMHRFYRELQAEESPDLSATLHTAQRWLRGLRAAQARELLATLPVVGEIVHDSDLIADTPADSRPFAHPRHWAAFTLVGGQ